MSGASLDLAALRRRAAERTGPAYWRSLEELAETPEFLATLRHEFPPFAAAASGSLDRRRLLQLMAASLALGGLTACGPEETPRHLVPYVQQPDNIVPGRANYYATATVLEGFATGVLVEHQMGRPVKMNGNPDHPASLGATGAIEQAAILGLYDPYRAAAVTQHGTIASWEAFVGEIFARRRHFLDKHGSGLAILTGTVTSPTLAAQLAALHQDFPEMRRHQWEAVHRDTARAAARLAFGRPADLVLDLGKADVILAIEGDFLDSAPGHLRYSNDFAARRRAAEVKDGMSRLYAIESTPTLAGAKADHRFALAPDAIAASLRYIAAHLGAGPAANAPPPEASQLAALAADLQRHRGRALVQVGRGQPTEIHALALAINSSLGAFGTTLRAIQPAEIDPTGQAGSLSQLVDDMKAGRVDTLVMLGANPVYTAPAELDFAGALAKARLSIYLGEYADETASRSTWHIAETHGLEAWSDARAFDGTATILQPQVRAFFGGRSAHELLAVLSGDTQPDAQAIVRATWQRRRGNESAAAFETFWRSALRSGVVPESAAATLAVTVRPDLVQQLQPAPAGGLTLLFRPDPGLWDGRFAGNGWLQEMPRPFTRLTWDNAAMLAPATAARLGLAQGDVAEIRHGSRSLQAPIWIMPGQAPDCISLPMGYGRISAGPVGTGIGFDTGALRPGDASWSIVGAEIRKLETRHRFAAEQDRATMEGRDLIRAGSLADFLAHPDFLKHSAATQSLYPGHAYDGIAWAMSINLNSCIGCQACVVACQSENNIPVVGKEEVLRGRVMHWLRIDRYYSGDLDAPDIAFQPVPCMHCENAPCEVVCPVQATVHDSEGLNVMVYNRCVGTRFCSNNCPYKVRRFNFFDYSGSNPRPRESWNPEVTVRARGVMEKCTYCIQRTRQAQIDADREDRAIRDGEVVTACQQACPTRAITFGNRNDPGSAVAARKASPLDYALLDELNTRPRTTYEAEIRNPNPDFGGA